MKAAVLEEKGIEVKDVDLPDLKPGEVLVRLKAAAINHRDIWITKGLYAGIKTPCILGSDGAGVVESTGDQADNTLNGKEVIINPNLNWGGSEQHQSKDYKIIGMPVDGTFAEYIAVPAENVFTKPAHLSFEEAAALPLGGLTAFRALFTRGRLEKGEKVLISGVGGGVAQFAFQFARETGAEVYVTSSSEEKIEQAKHLGAKGGINYKTENWGKVFKKQFGGIDLVIDSAGGDGFAELLNVMNPGGRIVLYGGTRGKISGLSPQIIFWKQLDVLGSTMGSDTDFQRMIDYVNRHKLKPRVDKVWPLNGISRAFAYVDEARQFGKVVIGLSLSNSH